MSLDLDRISHNFGAVAAVRGASLSAEAGEIVCLFGPSGCGKTTLLRIAAGLEPLQAGEVRLEGAVLAAPKRESPPEQRPIGFVFQDYVLFPHLTVEKNIAFGLKGVPDAKARVAGQLMAFGIEQLAKRYPHELSGGQQQRVALARAVARKPKALLLDEPFASIDVSLRRRLREELRRVLKEQKAAVLLVTHDADEALALGDRIALMREGEIIEIAAPEDLYEHPKTPDGAGLFPGSQVFSGEVRGGVFRCALGEVAAAGLKAGPAQAVLRADSLIASCDELAPFRVADVRFAGPGWRVRLEQPNGAPLWVTMSTPPLVGDGVSVVVDWSKAFVFPD
ncbi:ABC transporter ATP-binding protein [Hyphococcus sp.]|uniref:ABC transporter ATP-binding protein n=1 Tax=Hyphococcus sp. TaxID=2038636 RepID=UPI0035C6D7C9